MRVFAYCAERFADSARQAAGVTPLTCPPLQADCFDPGWLRGYELIYLDLHGRPGGRCWYGDADIPALSQAQVLKADLRGAVVFALQCHLGNDESPMLEALLFAGAEAVIAGDGMNWSDPGAARYGGAELGLWFRRALALHVPAWYALRLAKGKIRMDLEREKRMGKSGLVKAGADALEMRAWTRKDITPPTPPQGGGEGKI